MPEESNVFNGFQFPIVKNIAARTIGQDLKGFDPNNPKDVEEWGNMFKEMWKGVKEEFDKKGIPMPKIVLDSTPGPITYGIKTVDENGNEIHRQINNGEENDD